MLKQDQKDDPPGDSLNCPKKKKKRLSAMPCQGYILFLFFLNKKDSMEQI